jgi:Tol biopolymer transport system component
MVLVATLAIGCGGGSSSSGTTKTTPTITLTSIAPSDASFYGINPPWVPAGIKGFTLQANGSGFTSTSVMQWNGTALPTQFGTTSNLAATVSSTLVAAPGTASITVYDSATGAKSGTLSFGIASAAAATAGVVQIITVAPDGTPAKGNAYVTPSISATGRYVAFQSDATNLGAGVAGSWAQIYERDTCIGAPSGCMPSTIPITVTYDGTAPNLNSFNSSISGNGRYVAYYATATNILPNTSVCATLPIFAACVFVRDTCIGAPSGCIPTTTLISVNANGNPGNGQGPEISPDGRYIAFNSSTADIAGNNPADTPNVFLRDTCNGAPSGCTPQTMLVSQSDSGVIGNESSFSQAVNTGGRFVAFQSWSNNLIPDDTNTYSDIFVRDTCIGAVSGCEPSTTIESLGLNGAYGNAGLDGTVVPSISSDGRYVAFASDSTNMASGMTSNSCGYNGSVLVRDTCTGATTACTPATRWVSIANDGSLPNCGSSNQSMSADGRFIAFTSMATNLVPGDTFAASSWLDIFVRDTCVGAPTGCTPSTVRVSVANESSSVVEANGTADYPQISADGHYVVFLSESFNLTTPISNGNQMVYLAKTGF